MDVLKAHLRTSAAPLAARQVSVLMTRTLLTGRPASERRMHDRRWRCAVGESCGRGVGGSGLDASRGAAVGRRVRPFGEQRADEAFGFAVGLWPARLGEALTEPQGHRSGREDGGAVRAAVFGQEPLERPFPSRQHRQTCLAIRPAAVPDGRHSAFTHTSESRAHAAGCGVIATTLIGTIARIGR